MASHRARPAVTLVLFVLAGVAACASEKPVSVAPKSRDQTEYVSGIAAAYLCTCNEWPASWSEMERFDDFLHARSAAAGEPPLKRFPWSEIKASVRVHSDGAFIVTPKSDTHLERRDGAAAKADDEDFEPIAVPTPDCTRFDRTRFSNGCARAPALSKH